MSTTDRVVHFRELFEAQRRRAAQIALTGVRERIGKLERLRTYLLANRARLFRALFADFRKPAAETEMTELFTSVNELNTAIRHLRQWMKPQPVSSPLAMFGTSGHIRYEPKGVTLIIAPWNYPFYLLAKPLTSAIAAGNTAILKPSELTPHTAEFVRQMVESQFSADEVTVVEGDAQVAGQLLELPFDHIFFTGSTAVGKKVMEAAARNLSSVTLELGGKSPCLVDRSADLPTAARRIAWGKWVNAGQTCIAPDYVLVHQSVKDRLIDEIGRAVREMYDPAGKGVQASDSLARILNDRHWNRLKTWLDEAVGMGARVRIGGEAEAADRFIAPTVLDLVGESMTLMQEEIFGPLLPVIGYDEPEEALRWIRERPKPLVMYLFGRDDAAIRFFMARTSSGNAVINDTLVHFIHTDLPVGGVNTSGLGKANGFHGFQEFSNARGVVRRQVEFLKLIYPPYSEKKRKLISMLVKYL
ncbi:aldehyde dehydrogenase family protein [Larkinella soli]|uniref:aldehyde dehydrogenase family protein n=1 Tax=Larkinella soli TaxID=1770527 RepID=UPI000FFCC1B2|nr:aldehyde dehydrogenase family protein [Larkinella soli]